MKREAFLNRIAEAARRGRNHRVRPASTLASPPANQPTDRCAELRDELALVEIESAIVESTDQAIEQFQQWLRELQPKLVDISDDSLKALEDYQAAAVAVGARQIETAAESLAADVGVTGVDWAIANCGTLVLHCGEVRSRLTPIGPANHIAVVYERQILNDLNDLVGVWNAQSPDSNAEFELPANILMVTGPSKTGDIEMKLTRGVHGPSRVLVIVVRE